MQFRLEDLAGAGLRLFALVAPHLVNGGAHNNGWRGDYKGHGMLFAHGDKTYLAMAADQPFVASSVGFVGVSDGWQQLSRDRRLAEQYDTATDGNVALTAELANGPDGALRSGPRLRPDVGRGGLPRLDLSAHAVRNDPQRLRRRLALLAGGPPLARAARPRPQHLSRQHGRPARPRGADVPRRRHREPVDPVGIQQGRRRPGRLPSGLAARPRARRAERFWPAAGIRRCGASCVTCGRRRRPTDPGRRTVWLDGTPYWRGLQLDECAFPMLLLDMAWRSGALRASGSAALLAHGSQRRRLRHPKRSADQAGSMGRERRIHALHPRRRRRLAARRSGDRRGPGSRRGSGPAARHRRRLERADRRLGLRPGYAARARSGRVGILYPHRARIAADPRPRRSRACPGHEPRGRNRFDLPPTRSSARTRWRSCGSACARRTTRASSIRSR